ncbi:MAG: hypothetical protein PHX88_01475 [Methanoculleus horonobensis]|nr:hypothetical protein [Methanoculleus horonobensis]MDD4251525.1 hypothetical protein [Methanoculleus horonobensis]
MRPASDRTARFLRLVPAIAAVVLVAVLLLLPGAGEIATPPGVAYDPGRETLTVTLSPEDLSGDYGRYAAEIESIMERSGPVSVVVLNLRMTEPEMQQFLDAARDRGDLGIFPNDDRIERLQRLEINWLDESNPYETNTKIYEGEALKRKIREFLASAAPAPDGAAPSTSAAYVVNPLATGTGSIAKGS